MAAANQGRHFHIVEVPSFFPVAHRVRQLFGSFGTSVGAISFGLMGWLSVGVGNAYGGEESRDTKRWLEALEKASLADADLRYSISHLHNSHGIESEVRAPTIDMHDILEDLKPAPGQPTGNAPPDIWFVGRLDRNKGPDIFLEIVSRIPKELYGKCCLTGPDNHWSLGARWSEILLRQATELGIDAEYVGEISDEQLRQEVYHGNSLIVVPSRSDAFNLVALEALQCGCPIVLSNRAGAAEFLVNDYPRIAPPLIDPENVDAAAEEVLQLLQRFDETRVRLRKNLKKHGFRPPRLEFMTDDHWSRLAIGNSTLPDDADLGALYGPAWRSRSQPDLRDNPPDVSVIISMSGSLDMLIWTLVAITVENGPRARVIVIDDCQCKGEELHDAVRLIDPFAKIVTQPPLGHGRAFNHGLEFVDTPYVVFLKAGERMHGNQLNEGVAALQAQPQEMLHVTSNPSGFVFRRRAVEMADGLEEIDSAVIVSRLAQRIRDLPETGVSDWRTTKLFGDDSGTRAFAARQS